MKKVAILIPAYNEEKRIGSTLESYFAFFGDLKTRRLLDFEVIVILNGCKDNTRQVVEKFSRKELIILDFEQSGKGFAIIEGFKKALSRNNDFIGFVDADGATPPRAFYGLIKNINGYDGIIANRWDKRSLISNRNLFFRFRSSVFNFVVRSLFFLNHRDTQCGAKLFTRQLIDKIVVKLGSSEWSFDVDLLFYARYFGFKIRSIPTEWNDKKGSKVEFNKAPGRMFFSVLRLRLVHSPIRFLLRFHRKLPRKMQVSYWFGR